MTKSQKPNPPVPSKADDVEQSERFIETARSLDVDESDNAFAKTFRGINKQKLPSRADIKAKPQAQE